MSKDLIMTHVRYLRRADRWLTASEALRQARARFASAHWPDGIEGDYDGTASGVVDGFDIAVRVEYGWGDDYPGTFTNDPTDAVPLRSPDDRSYKYWLPESGYTVEMLAADYMRFRGMPKAVAYERALKSLQDEADEAADGANWGTIVVTASRRGVKLGDAAMSGCYVATESDVAEAVADYDLIGEAIDNARATLKELTR